MSARTGSREELAQRLAAIDGRPYGHYRDLRGAWQLGPQLLLFVDRVQSDPFAAPSRLRLRHLRDDLGPELRGTRTRRVASENWFARGVASAIAARLERAPRPGGSGGSGRLSIDSGGAELLERAAFRIAPDFVEARIEVGLPAQGRRILGHAAAATLLDDLPGISKSALEVPAAELEGALRFATCAETWAGLQSQLTERGLVAFLPDGAVLPRASGASSKPMAEAIPIEAPEALRVELEVPTSCGGGRIRGLGIPAGVTLVVGGGYHGKSTLLEALAAGVHPHVPGDGREAVVTLPSACTLRAESGRSVAGVDVSAYIGLLPGERQTTALCTADASGSTSQAAATVEAVEAGAQLLLIDEDTSATNFMVRDARMQALVADHEEPIRPFVDRVRSLYEDQGVSAVIVMGGCGDYLDVADTVIRMRDFRPEDATRAAREVAERFPTARTSQRSEALTQPPPRRVDPDSIRPAKGRRPVALRGHGRDRLDFGSETVDLRGLPQIVDPSQVPAVGLAIADFARRSGTIPEVLDAIEADLDQHGVEALAEVTRGEHPGPLARPRRYEIAAALNRLRGLCRLMPR